MSASGAIAPARYMSEGYGQGPQGGDSFNITPFRRTSRPPTRKRSSWPWGRNQEGTIHAGTGPPKVVLPVGPGLPWEGEQDRTWATGAEPFVAPNVNPPSKLNYAGFGLQARRFIGKPNPGVSGSASTFNVGASRLDGNAADYEPWEQSNLRGTDNSTWQWMLGEGTPWFYSGPHDRQTGGLGSQQMPDTEWGRLNQPSRFASQTPMEGPYWPLLTRVLGIGSGNEYQDVLPSYPAMEGVYG